MPTHPLSDEELINIRDKAERIARDPMIRQEWERAYKRLADAAEFVLLLRLKDNTDN